MPVTMLPVSMLRTRTSAPTPADCSGEPSVTIERPESSSTTRTGTPRLTILTSSTALIGIGYPATSVRRAAWPTTARRLSTTANVGCPARYGRSSSISSLMTSPALMVTEGTGRIRFSSCASAPPAMASQIKPATNPAPRCIMPVMTTTRSAHILGYGLRHLVGRSNHLGVHLIGALRLDQLGDFLDGIDVRGFQVGLADL